ncbi:MAG: hypothetical protein GSR79_09010 [Desulfurococcales archaeon]|nr:hypothetical protein [Desulfurococcales archaeon]
MNAVEFIALLLVLAFIGIPIVSLYKSTTTLPTSTTITEKQYTNSELAHFTLSQSPTPKPMTFHLSNGTLIIIKDRNPFSFRLSHTTTLSIPLQKLPAKLPVYRVVPFNTTDELISALKNLNLNPANVTFNKKTNTFVYTGSDFEFTYNRLNGRFNLIFKNPVKKDPIMFVQKAGLLSWDFIIYKTDNEISLKRLFQGIPSTLGITIELKNGSIKEISGWLFKQIYLTKEYPVVNPTDIYTYLANRISGKVVSNDWYINNLAFTSANINSLSIEYTLTQDYHIVPVYVFSGSYRLNIDGIPRDGQLRGAILGIMEKS